MQTGIELIAQERKEQIEKHGWDIEHDKVYTNGELVQAARFCMSPEKNEWPVGWNRHFMYKILNKTEIQRLTVAGAFYKAENDRLGFGMWDERIEIIAGTIDDLLKNQSNPPIIHTYN